MSHTKASVIASRLMSAGISEDLALEISHECLNLAYKKNTSTKAMSLEEYESYYGDSTRFMILEYLTKATTPKSRAELSRELGLRLSNVCGRVHELIQEGSVAVSGSIKDPITGKTVQTVVSIID